ncbi:LysR family transcriptional regulator [Sinobaca sp. H24]|uniref:LysR family transcriptional regulator n=1 Tax=Sinobaca sp. H24 TaxID=2923376 RepID=UPI002079AF2E|nr:LysR family transcriptional regulator [Sinobaca sp. H24]
MNYKLVETFAVLARTLSVTKTAEKLFLSQSAVSHRLKKLEEELGVTLIVRSKGFKNIRLTDQGEVFKSIAIDWENINDKMQNFNSLSSTKKLTIGIIDSVNNYLFRDIYQHMTENSNVQLTIKTEHTREIYEQVGARIIDIGFVLHNIPSDQIERKTILEEEMVLATKNPDLIHQKSIKPQHLHSEDQIFMNWGCLFTMASSLL